jgi:peptide/nickel transport system permease protein
MSVKDFLRSFRDFLTSEDTKFTLILFRRNFLNIVGTAIILLLVFTAIFAPVLSPYDPIAQNMDERLAPPDWKHILGTDQLGRDILSRIIWGSRISLLIAVVVVSISLLIGLFLGTISGYFGGWIDEIIMRLTDMFMAFPRLILALAVAAALGPGIFNTMMAISFVSWPLYARLARATALQIKNETYIEAARAIGASTARIIFRHLVPMTLPPILIQATLDMGGTILTAAGLGFLGLGVQPPTPEWGVMVSDGRRFITDQWWVSTFPGLAILLATFGFNLIGDGLRDIMDVRAKR